MSKQILIGTTLCIISFLLGFFLATQIQFFQPEVTNITTDQEQPAQDTTIEYGPLSSYTIDTLFSQHECLLNEDEIAFLCFDGENARLLTYDGEIIAPGIIENGVLKLNINGEEIAFHIIMGFLFEESGGVLYDKGSAHISLNPTTSE